MARLLSIGFDLLLSGYATLLDEKATSAMNLSTRFHITRLPQNTLRWHKLILGRTLISLSVLSLVLFIYLDPAVRHSLNELNRVSTANLGLLI